MSAAIPPHCLNTPSSTPADSHPAAYYVGEHGQFGLRGENHDTRDGVSYWKKLALSAMVKKKLFGLRRSKDEPLQLAVQQTSVEQEYSVRRGVNDDNTRSIEWFSHSFPTAVGSRRDAGFRSLRRVTPREKPNERMPFEAEDVIMRECAFASTVSANAPIFADYKVTPAGMQARNDDIQPEMPVADRVEDRSRLLHHVTEDGVLRPLREGPHGTELPRGLASSIRLVGQVSRSKTLDR
ncbi:hypothetical protein C8R45DRAFT_502444 [Mycena sanguinolenta]|nr:hypothetical protein C8R45DRAFT_502444 [Mycena sanguinolenta]